MDYIDFPQLTDYHRGGSKLHREVDPRRLRRSDLNECKEVRIGGKAEDRRSHGYGKGRLRLAVSLEKHLGSRWKTATAARDEG